MTWTIIEQAMYWNLRIIQFFFSKVNNDGDKQHLQNDLDK